MGSKGVQRGQNVVNLNQNALNWVPSGSKWHQHALKWVKTGSSGVQHGPTGSKWPQNGLKYPKMAFSRPNLPESSPERVHPAPYVHRGGGYPMYTFGQKSSQFQLHPSGSAGWTLSGEDSGKFGLEKAILGYFDPLGPRGTPLDQIGRAHV